MQLIIFDDNHISDFYPLSLTRPVFELRCGILKLRQRLESSFGDDEDTIYITGSHLAKLYQERHPDWLLNQTPRGECLYVNSRLKITEASLAAINELQPESCLYESDSLVAARTTQDIFAVPDSLPACITLALSVQYGSHPQLTLNAPLIGAGKKIESASQKGTLSATEVNNHLYISLSDLIHDNSRMLEFDFQTYFYDKDNSFETEPGVTVLHPYNVWIGEGVELAPGVVIDASSGPVVIDEAAKVMPNAVLCGPLYVGKNSLIKIGAKIYGGTSIGKVCKVGGEVEGTIFQGYSNKQHDGFLGHAYIGEWVNLGADTNNSDLKNTYKNVAYYSYTTKSKLDSGTQFLGCFFGDHSKTGINCSINTGAVIGIGCNLYGRGLISDFIPDFSWGEAGELVPHRFEAFAETATLVKQRRKMTLEKTEIEYYKSLYKMEKQCKTI